MDILVFGIEAGHSITFEIQITPKVKLTDSTLKMGNIDLAAVGISRMGGTQRVVAFSDGGNGVIMMDIDTDGELNTYDTIPNDINANNRFFVTFTETFVPNYMLDSACDKFYWKRTA